MVMLCDGDDDDGDDEIAGENDDYHAEEYR